MVINIKKVRTENGVVPAPKDLRILFKSRFKYSEATTDKYFTARKFAINDVPKFNINNTTKCYLGSLFKASNNISFLGKAAAGVAVFDKYGINTAMGVYMTYKLSNGKPNLAELVAGASGPDNIIDYKLTEMSAFSGDVIYDAFASGIQIYENSDVNKSINLEIKCDYEMYGDATKAAQRYIEDNLFLKSLVDPYEDSLMEPVAHPIPEEIGYEDPVTNVTVMRCPNNPLFIDKRNVLNAKDEYILSYNKDENASLYNKINNTENNIISWPYNVLLGSHPSLSESPSRPSPEYIKNAYNNGLLNWDASTYYKPVVWDKRADDFWNQMLDGVDQFKHRTNGKDYEEGDYDMYYIKYGYKAGNVNYNSLDAINQFCKDAIYWLNKIEVRSNYFYCNIYNLIPKFIVDKFDFTFAEIPLNDDGENVFTHGKTDAYRSNRILFLSMHPKKSAKTPTGESFSDYLERHVQALSLRGVYAGSRGWKDDEDGGWWESHNDDAANMIYETVDKLHSIKLKNGDFDDKQDGTHYGSNWRKDEYSKWGRLRWNLINGLGVKYDGTLFMVDDAYTIHNSDDLINNRLFFTPRIEEGDEFVFDTSHAENSPHNTISEDKEDDVEIEADGYQIPFKTEYVPPNDLGVILKLSNYNTISKAIYGKPKYLSAERQEVGKYKHSKPNPPVKIFKNVDFNDGADRLYSLSKGIYDPNDTTKMLDHILFNTPEDLKKVANVSNYELDENVSNYLSSGHGTYLFGYGSELKANDKKGVVKDYLNERYKDPNDIGDGSINKGVPQKGYPHFTPELRLDTGKDNEISFPNEVMSSMFNKWALTTDKWASLEPKEAAVHKFSTYLSDNVEMLFKNEYVESFKLRSPSPVDIEYYPVYKSRNTDQVDIVSQPITYRTYVATNVSAKYSNKCFFFNSSNNNSKNPDIIKSKTGFYSKMAIPYSVIYNISFEPAMAHPFEKVAFDTFNISKDLIPVPKVHDKTAKTMLETVATALSKEGKVNNELVMDAYGKGNGYFNGNGYYLSAKSKGMYLITECDVPNKVYNSNYASSSYSSIQVLKDDELIDSINIIKQTIQDNGAKFSVTSGIRGNIINSSAGWNSITTKNNDKSSAKASIHYTGCAIDLWHRGACNNVNFDPYIVTPNPEYLYRGGGLKGIHYALFNVYARCVDKIKEGSDYVGKYVIDVNTPEDVKERFGKILMYNEDGGYWMYEPDETEEIQELYGRYVDVTSLFLQNGWTNIQSLLNTFLNVDTPEYNGSEWWHFQFEKPLKDKTWGEACLACWGDQIAESKRYDAYKNLEFVPGLVATQVPMKDGTRPPHSGGYKHIKK